MIDYITVAVTLALGVLGLIVNSILQRKNNSISTVTNTRIAGMEKLQKCMQDILTYSDAHYLGTMGDKLLQNENVRNLTRSVSELRSLLSCSFETDAKVCAAAESILDTVQKFFAKETTGEEIAEARKRFEALIDPYIQTEWRRIKVETVGKRCKGLGKLVAWNKAYEEYREYYDKWHKE